MPGLVEIMIYEEAQLGRKELATPTPTVVLLLSKCVEHNLIITNTIFRQKNKLKTSWMHPCSKLWHLIDYIVVRTKDRP